MIDAYYPCSRAQFASLVENLVLLANSVHPLTNYGLITYSLTAQCDKHG